MAQIMNLGMAVMAACNTIVGASRNDLIVFQLTVIPSCISEPGLEESSPAAATVVVGFIRCHLDDIFFTNHRFYDETKIICHCISIAFADNLAGILDSEGYPSFFIPV